MHRRSTFRKWLVPGHKLCEHLVEGGLGGVGVRGEGRDHAQAVTNDEVIDTDTDTDENENGAQFVPPSNPFSVGASMPAKLRLFS